MKRRFYLLLMAIAVVFNLVFVGCSENPTTPITETVQPTAKVSATVGISNMPMINNSEFRIQFTSLSGEVVSTVMEVTKVIPSPTGNYSIFESSVDLPVSAEGSIYYFKALHSGLPTEVPVDPVYPDQNITNCVYLNYMQPYWGNEEELFFKIYPNGSINMDVRNDVQVITGESLGSKPYISVQISGTPDGEVHQMDISVSKLVIGPGGRSVWQPVIVPVYFHGGWERVFGLQWSGAVSPSMPQGIYLDLMPNPSDDVYFTATVKYYYVQNGERVIEQISNSPVVSIQSSGYRYDYPGYGFPVFRIPAGSSGWGGGKG